MSEARDYPRLKCVAFGRELITSQDLDPVYSAMHRVKLPSDQLARMLVAYWCLYHLGAAARLSELKEINFWTALGVAAKNDERAPLFQRKFLPEVAGGRWPRGTERRHWRGQQSVRSFESVLGKARCGRSYKPSAEHLVQYLAGGVDPDTTFQAVTERVQELRGFGPWIAFKVADMLERVAGYKVDFYDCALGFYDEPAKGAALLKGVDVGKLDITRKGRWEVLGESKQGIRIASSDAEAVKVVKWAVAKLSQAYAGLKAPPDFKRGINVQEIETVLCKWKSHLNGHYAPGKDTREVFHGLAGWGDLADNMRVKLLGLKYCPAGAVGKGGK